VIDPEQLAKHYSRFRVTERILLTGHSHQAWPDVAFEAQQQAWLDAAEHVDDVWDLAFEKANECVVVSRDCWTIRPSASRWRKTRMNSSCDSSRRFPCGSVPAGHHRRRVSHHSPAARSISRRRHRGHQSAGAAGGDAG